MDVMISPAPHTPPPAPPPYPSISPVFQPIVIVITHARNSIGTLRKERLETEGSTWV